MTGYFPRETTKDSLRFFGEIELPRPMADVVLVDLIATHLQHDGSGIWTMDADARVRLWDARTAWIRPGTFVDPAEYK